jgi:hypothetical protein
VLGFDAAAEIVNYVSEVVNGDMPYPYAVFCDGWFYLIAESVRLEPGTAVCVARTEGGHPDPYAYFYANNTVVRNRRIAVGGRSAPTIEFEGYTAAFRTASREDLEEARRDSRVVISGGRRECYLWYQPGEGDLGYDWTRGGADGELFVARDDEARDNEAAESTVKLGRAAYMAFIRRFARGRGFSPLAAELLHPGA